jgi:hypothetical protein
MRLGACAFAAVVLWVVQISGAAQVNYRNAVLGDGATAYYEFEELGDPTILIDSAGGDNSGSYVGGVGRTLASAYPNLEVAATFDGVDDRIRITDAATFDVGTGAFTVEMWFRTNTAARGDLFTYKGAGGDFGIHSNSQTPPPAGFTGSVSPYLNNFSSGTSGAGANINEWHHLAFTRDAAGTVTTYIDGQPRLTGTDTDTLNIANDLLIGSNHEGNPSTPAIPFSGAIDEVAWYPVALTQAQIQNHINQAVPEPASASVLAAGALLLLGWRRRR